MRKVCIDALADFECCEDCPESSFIGGTGYCLYSRGVERVVSQYCTPEMGFHPQCPLPNLPEGEDADDFIKTLIANVADRNSKEMRFFKT